MATLSGRENDAGPLRLAWDETGQRLRAVVLQVLRSAHDRYQPTDPFPRSNPGVSCDSNARHVADRPAAGRAAGESR